MKLSLHLLRTALLVGLCLGASAAATRFAGQPLTPIAGPVEPPLRLAASATPMTDHAPAPAGPETLSRPVFSPERRPFAPPPPPAVAVLPAVAPPAPQPAEALSLVGVLIEEGRRQALLAAPSFPEGRWLEIGATVSGATITSIDAGSVALSSGAGLSRLQLYVDNLDENPPAD